MIGMAVGTMGAYAEDITATLEHTASAVWGSNSGPNTVDNETEYYNNDAATAWAAVAYAEFSLSIPEGSSVTGATLTYSVNQGGNYTRDDIIYYMNAGFTLDYDYLLESTGTDLRYTDSRTVAVESATTGGTGDRMNLTQDVTAAVQAIVNAGQDYIIFQWTGNAAGCQLYGKASEYAPTLTITTASADEMTTYTVRFVDEEGSELKSDTSYAVVIGETATASDDDMASFYSEDGTIKYVYESGNDTITASEDAESNVITLTFREADTYSYTAVAVVATDTFTLVTGSDFEGETVYFTYPRHYNMDGTLYRIASQTVGSGYTSAGYYKGSITLSRDGQTAIVFGYSEDVTNVVFYSEAEDIEGLTAFTGYNADVRCSGGTAANNTSEEPVVITTLEPGKYVLYSSVWGNAGTEFLFKAGDVEVLSLTTAGYLLDGNSDEFEITGTTDITLDPAGTSGRGIDFVYIVKTGSVATTTECATGVLDFNALDVPVSSGTSTAGDITTTTTYTADEFTVTVSPKDDSVINTNRMYSTDDGPQLRMFSGTLTITGLEGRRIARIVFDVDEDADGVAYFDATPDDGELDGTTWTTDNIYLNTVVFTINSNTRIDAITLTGDAEETGEAQEYRLWDFTSWSDETVANLEADASEYVSEPWPEAGTETGWRRYEKDGGATDSDPLRDSGIVYWYGSLISEPMTLEANGEVIAETEGLLFNNVTSLNSTVAIAIDYPETSIGTYDGGSYLWLNGAGLQLTIPNVQPGQKIVMDVESHRNGNERGVTLSVGDETIDTWTADEKTTFECIVPEDLGSDLVDVIATTTSGCHIYRIEVGDADLIATGITEVNTGAAESAGNGNVYTINGVMVRKAGDSLDGLAKGLYIVGGKKVVIK